MTDPKIMQTINHLFGCHRTCVRQTGESLDLGAAHAARDHITQLMDCAAICRLAADILDRRSPWALALCELAAQACTATAESCERLDEKICARTCRETAEVLTLLCTQLTAAP
ncbi:MAG: four-helix bundle copper-binding protein [Nocardia sp.]|uniref:four-helix bundle copper-binding protein n=1 Tax=Nocardia sp. TaxID=1821 RepID=UPI00261A68BE|nr:four-helix bundle copper-binding protein [Nocardia sp.]MCU1644432.1 four-helix bundle copper-binding protein [Nocardia sp.]